MLGDAPYHHPCLPVLPLALDLFATLAEAGLGFDASLAKIQESQPPGRALTMEFHTFQREMLAGVPFDLLVNTTSMPSHYPVNKKALQAKRHVWSEKPIALDLKDGKELLDLAMRNGVHFWGSPTCVTSPSM